WYFSSDPVRFLQVGRDGGSAALGKRGQQPNSIQPDAGADGWCRIRWTVRTRTPALSSCGRTTDVSSAAAGGRTMTAIGTRCCSLSLPPTVRLVQASIVSPTNTN